MAGVGTEDRIIQPLYLIKGFKGQLYLLARYAYLWMEQRVIYIALKRNQKLIKQVFLLFNSVSMICALTVLILSLKKHEHEFSMAGVSLERSGSHQNLEALTIMILTSVVLICAYGYWFLLKEHRTQIINFIFLCGISIIFNMVLLIIQLIGTAELYHEITLYPVPDVNRFPQLKAHAFWNELQSEGKCCGLNGPVDWKGFVPLSCCPNDLILKMRSSKAWFLQVPRKDEICDERTAYQKGCRPLLDRIVVWPAVVFSTVVSQGFAFLAALFYYFVIKVTRGYEVYPASGLIHS